ncbi:hypothetical protein niasHT_029856 [Heterodera trifolii]|uniref:JmjC domain-containing protein n=1 Tax=Heterodera trifolii TaxID=157864 RepID=A0ABD2K5G6_9BILA
MIFPSDDKLFEFSVFIAAKNNLWLSFALSDDGNELEWLKAQREAIDAKIAAELARRKMKMEGNEATPKDRSNYEALANDGNGGHFNVRPWCKPETGVLADVVCDFAKWSTSFAVEKNALSNFDSYLMSQFSFLVAQFQVVSGEWRGDNFDGSKNGGHGERRQKKNGEIREVKEKEKKRSFAGGLGIRFRNEQLKQAAARRTTGAGEAQQAVEECQPGTSRRKQQFTAKVYEENGLPAEILACRVKMARIGLCRRDGALSYLIEGNGYEYYVRTVLTTTNLGTEILAFTDESEAGIERVFFVPKKQWYYGSQWFAPPAETMDSYRQISQLMESCNGPYVKMTSLPDDARMIRGLCAPPATSAFALHREEEHVHHLNYNLGPGLKLWLFVGGQWEKKAVELGKALFGDRWPLCRNPLGHNSFFFSPAQLRKAGIPFEFHIQRPGDAVLTVGLHCGINVGASVCLVKELLIGQKTRCDCRSSREFYQYSEQSQEYLQGVKEMESSAKEKARKLRYEQSGHREKTTSKEQLASQRREQRARQKAEGRVPVPKTKKMVQC